MKSGNNQQFTYLLPLFIPFMISLTACEKDEVVATGDPSEVSFAVNSQAGNEGEGIVQIMVKLSQPQNVRTVVNFKVEGNALSNLSTLKQADFELITEPPLIIEKDQSSAFIEVRILEDKNFEQNLEHIRFTLDAVLEGNAELSRDISKLSHVYEIQENDYQLFLEWDNTVEDVNMNMFVELPNKQLLTSESQTGFEKLTITNTRDMEQYFVDVWYQSGNADVEYTLKCLKAGEEEKQILVGGHFQAEQAAEKAEGRNGELIKNHLLIKSGRDLMAL